MVQSLSHIHVLGIFYSIASRIPPGRVLGGHLQAMLKLLGPTWVHLATYGAILGHPRAILGQLGAILGPTWGHLGPSWANLGPSWGQLGPSWGQLGPSWGHLGASWGQLGASWGRLGRSRAPLGAQLVAKRLPRAGNAKTIDPFGPQKAPKRLQLGPQDGAKLASKWFKKSIKK